MSVGLTRYAKCRCSGGIKSGWAASSKRRRLGRSARVSAYQCTRLCVELTGDSTSRLDPDRSLSSPLMTDSPTRLLRPLYGGTYLFGVSSGISLALTPLLLTTRGFDKEALGTLALFFAAGLVSFSLPAGKLMERFGARTVLTNALAAYAVCVALFPFLTNYWSIALVRFFDGSASICIWIASETVVLARADSRHKAHLTSLYAIWLASGYVTGPFLARALAPWTTYESSFLLAASASLLAAGYLLRQLKVEGSLAAAGDKSDSLRERVAPELSTLALLGRIKTSCAASFSYGYFQSSVVLFLPLYLIESKGIREADTIVLPGLFCLGMLLFSNGAGRRADASGHLLVIVLLSTLGMGCVLGFVFVDPYWLMCTLVFAAGATLAAMSPIALALTGVLSPRTQLEQANSLYNTFYASGIFLGPPLSSFVFSRMGGAAMLIHLALLWAAFIGFALLFAQDDPAWPRRQAGLPLAED